MTSWKGLLLLLGLAFLLFCLHFLHGLAFVAEPIHVLFLIFTLAALLGQISEAGASVVGYGGHETSSQWCGCQHFA